MDAVTTVQQSDIEMQEYSHTYKLILSTDTIIRRRKHNRATLYESLALWIAAVGYNKDTVL